MERAEDVGNAADAGTAAADNAGSINSINTSGEVSKDTVINVLQPTGTEITGTTTNSATGIIHVKNVKVNTKVSKVDSVKNASKNALNKAQRQLDKKIENAMNQ